MVTYTYIRILEFVNVSKQSNKQLVFCFEILDFQFHNLFLQQNYLPVLYSIKVFRVPGKIKI